MKKFQAVFLFLFSTALSSHLSGQLPLKSEQPTGISITGGVATFAMDELKYLQEQMLSEYPVEGKVISSFPMYSLFSVNMVRDRNTMLRLGVGYGLSTTGARSDYSDFSGSISTNFTITSHRIGAFAVMNIWNSDRIRAGIYGRADGNFSRLKITSSIQTYSVGSSRTDPYNGFSPNLSAGLELLFHVGSLELGWEGGYLVDVPGTLKHKDSKAKLVDPEDRSRYLHSDWSGWRTGIKLIHWLSN